MEEQNKNPEELTSEADNQQENRKQGTPTRSCILMLLAGAYLIYTGYRLCKNVIDGVEGGSWGFFAAGVGFLIVGVVMLVVGGKNFIKNDKEKKTMEALAAEAAAKEAEDEKPVEKKNRSIAERAKLVSALEEAEETEKMNSTRKTEE